MSGLRSNRRKRPELPLVPLIDILVMLVFFAFVTMRFSSSRTFNITVPKMQTAGQNQVVGSVEIAINSEGEILLDGQVVTIEQMEPLLRQVQQLNRDTTIVLRGDQETQLGKVTAVLDLCRSLGLNKVLMQARR